MKKKAKTRKAPPANRFSKYYQPKSYAKRNSIHDKPGRSC